MLFPSLAWSGERRLARDSRGGGEGGCTQQSKWVNKGFDLCFGVLIMIMMMIMWWCLDHEGRDRESFRCGEVM